MITLMEFTVTRRDQQILRLLLEGCSNKEIASELNISPRTVKQHLRSLFQRAGINGGRKRVQTGDCAVVEGAIAMQSRNRLTPREVEVASLCGRA
jgi:DNA-binding NarL/FixJ family response regulator